METIGERVKRLRSARGYTQTELGDLAGITQSTISGIENGDRQIRPSSIIELAHALRTEAYYLKYGKGRESIDSTQDSTQQLLLDAFPLLDEGVREIWLSSARAALKKVDEQKKEGRVIDMRQWRHRMLGASDALFS